MQTAKPQRREHGHYATDQGGHAYWPAGAFNFDAHDAHVESGHCPVVSWTKAWCTRRWHDGLMAHHSQGGESW